MTALDWLLDSDSDPAIRWQALRDLTDAPEDVVAAERARVATEGWGARLLALRDLDGQWAGGACFPASGWDGEGGQPWTPTLPTLALLREFGLDPASDAARETVALVGENCRWEYDGARFFDGEVEPCINGRVVAVGAYFGQDVEAVVQRLLDDQLEDGGWNCFTEHGSTRSSFDSTINVLEGLLAYEQAGRGTAQTRAARQRGEEYLLERSLFRRRSTGQPAQDGYLQFSFPPQWHHDVLRALDHFRTAGSRDERLAEAVAVVRSKQQPDGRWLLEATHPGAVHFPLEDGDGQPSRWNTLRALRVLRWHDRQPPHDV
ncbi:hypothetical protein [Modestobacter altitudinis]|uniref:hypothetical protein n=1 Tax=Modestobacter altitudinis TaxID=2213158 RepID=UPI00110CEA89|nr:hypothetical protein [Modestobacter altitudinis]